MNKDVKRPCGVFPSLPSGMDAILKKHFDSFRDKNMLPPELADRVEAMLFNDVELLKVWRSNRKGIRWEDSKGNVLMGAVDNILEKDDKLIVLDYKTRGFPLKEDTADHYQDQLDLYNFLLRKNSYETEDYAYLLFYYPKEVNESGEVVFETELVKMNISVENAESIFNGAIAVLEGDMPNPSEECEYCKWKEDRI